MNNMIFANPEYLYLLVLIVFAAIWYIFRQNKISANIQISSTKAFAKMPKSYKYYLRHLLFLLRIAAFALLIIALARPQAKNSWKKISTEGIDIVLTIDISGSMLAEDLKPNRLEASKDVAIQFISGRELDRIGLVVFSGESFTQCPLTTDHKVLINLFNELKSGMIEDGTAIGLGLANAVRRLQESEAKSKVIILLTDGVNNVGDIDPITAAEIAQTYGIRVYTIGVGTLGMAPYPFQTAFGIQYQNVEVKIDEEVLRKIAELTKAKYFRATDNKTLKEIYTEIDKLEKSKIEEKEFSRKEELFLTFALWAALCIIFEILLKNSLLRTIP